MNQKLLIIVTVITLLGGYLIYENRTKLLSSTPQTAEEYCTQNNQKDLRVASIKDCGEYKIVNYYGCSDCAGTVLDKDWNKIDKCGGFDEWLPENKKCHEKYPTKDSCITTSCIK